MERINNILIALLATLLAGVATSCKPHEEPAALSIELPSNTIAFTQAGGTQEVAVLSTEEGWAVEKDSKSDWLTVEQTKVGLKITASENTTGNDREARIAVSIKGLRQELKVTQDSRIKSINVDKEEHTFGSEGGELRIPVEANSSDWSYTLSEEASWIKVEKSADNKALIITAERSYDPNPRELYIAITYGESYTLHIRQVGVRLFPEFKLFNGMTRADVETYAKEAGLVEDTELIKAGKYDENWNWVTAEMTRKEAAAGSALFYVTDALQGKYLVYQFMNNDHNKVFAVHIIAKEGGKFEQSDVAGYLSGMGYFDAGKDMRGRDQWTKNDVTALKKHTALVFLEHNPTYQLGMAYPKAARLTFELPTDINPDEVGNIMTEFPMDRLDTFRDPAIKFEEVKAYELSRGFTLMEGHVDDYYYTKKSDIKGYTHLYEYAQFQRADIDSAKEGELISTHYSFLIPGLPKQLEYNILATPENAGSIGQRIDIYKGYRKFYERHPFTGMWNIKPEVVYYAKQKGYDLGIADKIEGRTYFTKGDDIIYIIPGETSVQVTFFRNKEVAETARDHKRED